MTKNCQTTVPFTFRLNSQEREQLKKLAKNLDISQGAFIRAKVFDGLSIQQKHNKSNALADRESLSQLLLLLGETRIANNLNQLAKHANMGNLNLKSEEIESQLEEAYATVQWMRKTLLKSLGLRA